MQEDRVFPCPLLLYTNRELKINTCLIIIENIRLYLFPNVFFITGFSTAQDNKTFYAAIYLDKNVNCIVRRSQSVFSGSG